MGGASGAHSEHQMVTVNEIGNLHPSFQEWDSYIRQVTQLENA